MLKRLSELSREGRLYSAVIRRMRPYLHGLKYLVYDPARNIKLHAPEYITPIADELPVVERIFRSFKLMKEKQKEADPVYLPSEAWQSILDNAYAHINDAAHKNDIAAFHLFLANFGCWKSSLGFEGGSTLIEGSKSILLKHYIRNDMFRKPFKVWNWHFGGRRDRGHLSVPNFGNHAGAYLNGVFLDPNCFQNDILGSIISSSVSDLDKAIIADLGGGSGKPAAFTLRNLKNWTYLDFDLPEVLSVAAYYLMMSFPEKTVLLYGEEEYPVEHEKYDLIFMPAYEMCKVPPRSIDLFINRVSLGEMAKKTTSRYIEDICRSVRHFFFHMNHDGRLSGYSYSDGDRGPLAFEYPIPEDQFRLLFRYPDLGHLLRQGTTDFNEDVFMHLYERKTI